MSIVDLNVCRVCLKSLKDKSGNSIIQNPNILEKFQQCTELKINKNDGLPTNICDRCYARLKVAFDFKQQSIVSDNHLREFINKINNQFNEVANTSKQETNEENEILYELGYVDENTNENNDNEQNKQQQQSEISEGQIEIHQNNNEIEFINEMEEEENDEEGEERIEQLDSVDDDYDGNGTISLDDDTNDNNEIDDDNTCWQIEKTDELQTISKSSSKNSSENYVLTEIVIDPLKPTTNDKNSRIKSTRHSTFDSKSKISNGSHICIKCNKDFSTNSNLQRHLDTHDGLRPYQCTLCGKGFTQNGSLKKHMLIHTGERPHVCDVCGRGFTQHTTLIFHMRRHTGERPYSCSQCGRAFRIKDALKRHFEEHHSVDTRPKIHICSICNRGLKSKYSLQMHLDRHKSDAINKSIFKCNECNRIFKTKYSLDLHIKRHNEIKKFKCMKCNEEFNDKITLKKHLEIHDDDIKPYRCNQCGKAFMREKLLNDHIEFLHYNNTVINSNSKLFQCELCMKTYKIKENLLQHIKTHKSMSKIYPCDECGVAFDVLRRYKLHRINKHNENITNLNECYICNTPFVSVKDLNDHLETVHDNIDELCEQCNEHFSSKKLFENHILEHQLEFHN